MKSKKEWMKSIKRANKNISESTLEQLWEHELRRRNAKKWYEKSDRYVDYLPREDRLELCEQVCLSLAEGLKEFWPIYEFVKRLRDDKN